MKGSDSMSFYYGISSDSVSSFFNSTFSSSYGKQSSSSLNDLYSSLGDYGTIRSGTYSRLMKTYYKKVGSSSSSTDSTNSNKTETTDKTIASDASALKNDADALSNAKFTEENRSKVTSAVSKFTESYNKLINATSSSKNHAVSQKYKSMTNLTSNYSHLLSSVGITINTDKTLSVDSTALAKADLSTLKSVFSGNYSYTSQVGNYAGLVYSANSNGVDSIYTNNGTLGTFNTSSILDTYA